MITDPMRRSIVAKPSHPTQPLQQPSPHRGREVRLWRTLPPPDLLGPLARSASWLLALLGVLHALGLARLAPEVP